MRILIGGMSNMLFQVISAVLAELPETVVVGRVTGRGSIAAQVRSTHADAVMMKTASTRDTSDIWRLLYRFPTLKVVTIATDGRGGCMHELLPSTRDLTELSGETLHAALHGHAGGKPH